MDQDKGVRAVAVPVSQRRRFVLAVIITLGTMWASNSQTSQPLAAQQESLLATIVSGTCDDVGVEVVSLNPASVPDSPAVGSNAAIPGANSFSTAAIGLDAILADPHAVVVTGSDGKIVTCGEIGGRLTESGSLIVGLHQDALSALGGVAVFSPDDSLAQTNVSLFVTGDTLGDDSVEVSTPARTTDSSTTPEASVIPLTQDAEPTSTSIPTEIPVPTPTPIPLGMAQNNPAPIGTTLESQGLAVTVTSAYFDYSFANAIPRGGYKVLIIGATFQNNSDRDLGYEASRFSAIDANTGNTYDPVTIDNVGVLLTGGNLQPGEYVSGTALVEVQETASNVIIKYDVDIMGDDDMYWS